LNLRNYKLARRQDLLRDDAAPINQKTQKATHPPYRICLKKSQVR
jgi:hypothetical protein